MAIRNMLYYAQKHPEIRIADGSSTLYEFVARDLAKANELIEPIEYPNGKTPSWNNHEQNVPPMRLSEEDLVNEMNRYAREQEHKSRNDIGKIIATIIKAYINSQILCAEFILLFGDGSGHAQLSGKTGPITLGECSTKDITDKFKQIFTPPDPQIEMIEDAKKLDSINHAKSLRLATTLRAFQLKGKAELPTKPHATTQTIQPTPQVPPTCKKAVQLTVEKHDAKTTVERHVAPQIKELIKLTGNNPAVFDHTETTPLAHEIIEESYNNIETLSNGLILSPGKKLPQAQTDLLFTSVNMSVAAADQAQRGNYEKAMEYNVAAYAHKCAAEFLSKGMQNAKAALNPLEFGNGVIRAAKAETQRAIIEEHADLAFAYAIIKDTGMCSADTHRILENQIIHNQEQDHLIYQYAVKDFETITASWHDSFKDGTMLGLARISGSLTGSFVFAPLTLKCLASTTAKILTSAHKFAPAVLQELKRFNSSLEPYRTDLQIKAEGFQKVLKEKFPEIGELPIAVTPEGVKIPLDLGPDVLQEPIAPEMAGKKENPCGGQAVVKQAIRQAHLECKNMHEVFSNTEFGKTLKECTVHYKNRYYNGEKVFQITEKINHPVLEKGDFIYFDSGHKNFKSHLEVFDEGKKPKAVLWPDGTKDEIASSKVVAEGRKLDIK